MRLMVLGVIALLAAPAVAQDRFGADNPWFQDFEATCRADGETPPMKAECQEGVMQGWYAYSGAERGSCDWSLFWDAADAIRSPELEVLPWQYGVEALFAHGVCSSS